MNLLVFAQKIKKALKTDDFPVAARWSLTQLFKITWTQADYCVQQCLDYGYPYDEVGGEIYIAPETFAHLMDYLPEELSNSTLANSVRITMNTLRSL